jgi:hypothetical protein
MGWIAAAILAALTVAAIGARGTLAFVRSRS